MPKQKTITIKWSYPREFENAKETELSYEGYGIYCISRKFGGNETILYIGKTDKRFRDRLKNHKKDWMSNYRGEKIVRFGTITKPVTVTSTIINDVESAIIYDIDPKHNKSKRKGYSYFEDYILYNQGYRGKLPKIIDIRNHINPV